MTAVTIRGQQYAIPPRDVRWVSRWRGVWLGLLQGAMELDKLREASGVHVDITERLFALRRAQILGLTAWVVDLPELEAQRATDAELEAATLTIIDRANRMLLEAGSLN